MKNILGYEKKDILLVNYQLEPRKEREKNEKKIIIHCNNNNWKNKKEEIIIIIKKLRRLIKLRVKPQTKGISFIWEGITKKQNILYILYREL